MDRRGVSDVLGFVLIFSLVAVTVATVSLGGFDALQTVRQFEHTNNAERGFDVVAQDLADIHQDGAPSRTTGIDLAGAQLHTTETITVRIAGLDTSTGESFRYEKSLTPVVWESNARDTEIVYALGAVLRTDGDAGTVTTDPPFVLAEDRTILSVVRTQTDTPTSVGGSTVTVRGTKASVRTVETDTSGSYDELSMTITTPRAAIWKGYLEARSGVDSCSVGSGQVVCELKTPDELFVSAVTIDIGIET